MNNKDNNFTPAKISTEKIYEDVVIFLVQKFLISCYIMKFMD
jgi:hypothetical protein